VSLAAFIACQRTSHRVPHAVSCRALFHSGGHAVTRPLKEMGVQPLGRFGLGMPKDQLHLEVTGARRPQQGGRRVSQVMRSQTPEPVGLSQRLHSCITTSDAFVDQPSSLDGSPPDRSRLNSRPERSGHVVVPAKPVAPRTAQQRLIAIGHPLAQEVLTQQLCQ
jgi:hypothetical protein